MKKIMIFGSTGMAGHILTYYLLSLNKYKVINISHKRKLNKDSIIMDIMDIKAVKKLIKKKKPDIIVNFIGILIKASEQRPDKAIFINSYFPHFLDHFGGKLNIKIIHLSTDCVFSGKIGDYKEMEKKDGEGFYAQSKALGEIINNKDLTFRTSIVGPELKKDGEGLFHWFMYQKGIVKGHSKVYWTGITTLELAKAVDAAIEQDLKGLYHLIPKKKISKYELLLLFKQIWNRKNVRIGKFEKLGVDKSLTNSRKDFNYRVKDYREMLKELYEWMKNHPRLYKQYEISIKTNVIITGYNGFIGKNLIEALKKIEEVHIIPFGREHKLEDYKDHLITADIIFHLAGCNRPKNIKEFERDNINLTKKLVDYIEKQNHPVPIVFASSIQAKLNNPYGISKKKAEDILFDYSKRNHVQVYIYQFPNVFGKWCKPNYNSVVATFCYNISHNLDITISDPKKEIELIYIDDVIRMFLAVLNNAPNGIQKHYQNIKQTNKITLQMLADKIYRIKTVLKKKHKKELKNRLSRSIYETYISYINNKTV